VLANACVYFVNLRIVSVVWDCVKLC